MYQHGYYGERGYTESEVKMMRRTYGDVETARMLKERAALLIHNLEVQDHYDGKRNMSQLTHTKALWCESGDHPFSEKDPLKKVIVISADNPLEDDDSWTICGSCRRQIDGPFGLKAGMPAPTTPPTGLATLDDASDLGPLGV